MTAYPHEYEFVKNEGVTFEFLAQPAAVRDGGLECLRTEPGHPVPLPIPGSNFLIPADHIIKAIGQQKTSIAALLGLETERGFIRVDPQLRTSIPRIYAGGDCIRAKGSASTVMAAQDGKIAAAAIHQQLMEAAAHG
jgi:glutamate synthase (NADPH/NADH) small chain